MCLYRHEARRALKANEFVTIIGHSKHSKSGDICLQDLTVLAIKDTRKYTRLFSMCNSPRPAGTVGGYTSTQVFCASVQGKNASGRKNGRIHADFGYHDLWHIGCLFLCVSYTVFRLRRS